MVLLSKKFTKTFLSGHVFTEIFQNHMLKVKIWQFLKPCQHPIIKDTEVSFEDIYISAKTLLILSPQTSNSITGIAIT